MFAAGLKSKVETTGPAYVRTTSPSMLKWESLSIKSRILSSNSASLTLFCFFGGYCQKSVGGSLKFLGFSLTPRSICSKSILFSSSSSTTSVCCCLFSFTFFAIERIVDSFIVFWISGSSSGITAASWGTYVGSEVKVSSFSTKTLMGACTSLDADDGETGEGIMLKFL